MNIYQDVYNANFGLDNCDLQSKYMQMMKQNESNLLDEELNDSDADLLNLLATEDDCTTILRNIASDFVNSVNFMDTNYCDKMSYGMPNLSQDCLNDTLNNLGGSGKESAEEYKCAQCDKICTSKKMLRYHLKSHSDVKPYSCDICSRTFKQRYEVTAHKRSHYKPSFQCDICSSMFVHKSHLNNHRKKHAGDFVAFCNDCNKGFVTQSSYKNHVKVQHEKILHMCDICGQQLSSISALNEHKNIHDPNYQKDHVCDMCGKAYLTARNLKTHLKTHMQLRTYVCNICGKSLSSKKILETHIKMHIGEKDFACQFCNKTFAAKEYLTSHLRTHTGDKPFRCQICDKSFTQRTTLTVHLRYHSGERPYKCHCGKGFITKSHLIGHYKTHEVANLDFTYMAQ